MNGFSPMIHSPTIPDMARRQRISLCWSMTYDRPTTWTWDVADPNVDGEMVLILDIGLPSERRMVLPRDSGRELCVIGIVMANQAEQGIPVLRELALPQKTSIVVMREEESGRAS